MNRDARDYLIELYENGCFNDIIIQGLICWLSSDEAEEFCRLYDLEYYDEEQEEEEDY